MPALAGLSMREAAQSEARVVAVDLARVLAILFMVQGHALDVLLNPAYRQGFLFNKWLFLRGLTAPTFFVLSGMSFTIASMRHWQSHLSFSPKFFRRVRRFALFVLLGYLMHWPAKTIYELKGVSTANWQSGLQVDVLQCIGVTLAFLQFLVLVTRTPARFAKVAAACGAAVVLLTPLLWKVEWTLHLPIALGAYLSGRTGSFFPLFPWSAYPFFGVMLGYIYMRRRTTARPIPILPLMGVAAALILLGEFLRVVPITVYQNIDYWKTSPNLYLIRVGDVCLILAILHWLTQKVTVPAGTVRSLAEESLTVYFLHVCVLYGSLWNLGLRDWIGPTLTPLPMLGWIVALLTSMVLFALGWNWLKRAEPNRIQWVRAAIALAVAYSFT